MKKLSFQWRVTLMTALLIAAACVALNLLLFRTGSTSIDIIGRYVYEVEEGDAASLPGETVYLDLTEEQFGEFLAGFSEVMEDSKASFGQKGWLITAGVTLLSAVIAYFVSGRSLKPLRSFSEQAERIQMKTLTDIRLEEEGIPEFQALSRSINRMLARLAEGFEAQRQFSGNAAHELRTPLALIQARLDLYGQAHAEASPEIRETLELMKEQTGRLSRMVKTLLEMSDLENIARDDLVALGPMVEEVLTDLMPLAERQGLKLEQSGEDITLTGSDELLYRLLFNLVENAVKYNCPGGSVRVCLSREGDEALIRVRDTGYGIPQEYRDSVFHPFFRVDKSRSRALGSVGLGLSLVWEIVRLHGGNVRVEESGASGTQIAVRLPVSIQRHENAEKQKRNDA